MKQQRRWIVAFTVLLCALSVGLSYAGDKVKVKGLITTRTGETLTLKTADGGNVTVVLSDDTKVQQPKGLGLRKKQMSATGANPRAQGLSGWHRRRAEQDNRPDN